MKIRLVDFKEPTFQNFTFDPIIQALLVCLSKLNHEVTLSIRETDPDAINICIAFHRVFVDNFHFNLPKKTIILNLEPLELNSKIERYQNYIKAISSYPVIDYSYENKNFLNTEKIFIFKFGFFNFPNNYENIQRDKFTFLGTLSNRRILILNQIARKFKNVQAIHNLWGIHRDNVMLKSKAILNINKNENSILEVYRIWHSLCLGVPVISENGVDKKLKNEWVNFINFSDDLLDFNLNEADFNKHKLYKKTSFLEEVVNLINWITKVTN